MSAAICGIETHIRTICGSTTVCYVVPQKTLGFLSLDLEAFPVSLCRAALCGKMLKVQNLL